MGESMKSFTLFCLLFLLPIFLLILLNDYQIWYLSIIILLPFFWYYRKITSFNLILFVIYISLFGRYVFIPGFSEIQIYRLAIIPLVIYILFKGLKDKKVIYFIFFIILLYILLQQILVTEKFSLNNYLFIINIYIVLSISLLTYYVFSKNKGEQIFNILKYFLIFNVGVAIFELITAKHLIFSNINNYTLTAKQSPTGFFFNQNDLGVFSLLILQIFILMKNGIKNNLMIFIFSTFLIFVTASRTVMILYFVFLISYFIFNLFNYLLKKYQKLFISFLFFFLSIFIVIASFLDINSFETNNYTFNKILSITDMFDSRGDLYQNHIKIFLEYPFGLSANQYDKLVFQNNMTNSHSFLLEVGQRFGIVMLICLIMFIFYIIFKLLSEKRLLEATSFVITILLTNVNSTILTGFNVFWVIIVLQLVYFSQNRRRKI